MENVIPDSRFVVVSLPSKCLTYQGTDPDKIYLRPFNGLDEQNIAEINFDNLPKKFLEIIKSVVKGVDAKQLTSGDVKFIMLWEAINSYTNLYPLKFVCENCLQDIEVEIDLAKLEKVELSNDYTEPCIVQLSTGEKVGIRLLTISDEIEAFNFAKRSGSAYLYSYALSLVNEKDPLARLKLLEGMNTKDLNEIKKFHTKYEHGPNMESSYTCPECGGEGKVEVPFRIQELFSFHDES